MQLNTIDPLSRVNGVFGGTGEQDFSQPHHVHNSYIWLGGLRIFFVVLIAAAGSSISALIELFRWAAHSLGSVRFAVLLCVAGAVVILGITVFLRWLSYRNRTYVLTDHEFNLYSGIITKRHVHVPYQRIQSIDEQASLLQRLVGVCTLKIDTAGGASNKAVMLEYVQKDTAHQLRNELFHRKALALGMSAAGASAAEGAVPQAAGAADGAGGIAVGMQGSGTAGDAAGGTGAGAGIAAAGAAFPAGAGYYGTAAAFQAQQPVRYAVGLSNSELLLSGISNNTALASIITGALGLLGTLITALARLARMGANNPQTLTIAEGIVGIALVIGFGVAVLTWVIGALSTCLQYGGFSARRQGSRIEVQRGVLQHVYQGVDIDRVQCVIVRQTFVRRLMGYCELSLGKIESVGQSSSGQSGQTGAGIVIHPFCKVSAIPQVLEGLVPEFSWTPQQLIRVAPVARRRAINRSLTWKNAGLWLFIGTFLLNMTGLIFFQDYVATLGVHTVGLLNGTFVFLYVLSAIITACTLIDGLLWYRESYFGYDHRGVLIRNGGLRTETVVAARKKLQFAGVRSNPFQRAAGVFTVFVDTAAGVGGSETQLLDIDIPHAEAWMAWCEPQTGAPGGAPPGNVGPR